MALVLRDEGLKQALDDFVGQVSRLGVKRMDCLEILKTLPQTFNVPDFINKIAIKIFCLGSACLLFCAALSSAKLHTEGITPLKLLVSGPT